MSEVSDLRDPVAQIPPELQDGRGPAERRDVDATSSMPDGRWAFNAQVADVFDEMLERSIPQYDVMRQAVHDVAVRFIHGGLRADDVPDVVIDLGTSRGESIAALLSSYGARCRFVCVETSPPMREAFERRFHDWMNAGVVELRGTDLRTSFPYAPSAGGELPRVASVVLSILTLMFVPINHRQRLLQQAHDVLKPGGALIVVEKVLGSGARIDHLMVETYHWMKARNGYSPEEIDRKALALEGVQVPVTAAWNVEMLLGAGFAEVDCFWRWMNFAGFVAIKAAR